MRSRPSQLRPGLSLLEVVFAMALLGVVAMAVMSAISYVQNSQVREQRTLAANELANRLLLMYIDDPNSPWNEGETITWTTGEKYRWEMIRSSITLQAAVEPATDSQASASRSPINVNDRVHLVRARVWLDADSGGTPDFSLSTPHAELSRLMDPMANMTRPDTTKRMFENYRGEMTNIMQSGRVNGWRGRDGASRSGK